MVKLDRKKAVDKLESVARGSAVDRFEEKRRAADAVAGDPRPVAEIAAERVREAGSTPAPSAAPVAPTSPAAVEAVRNEVVEIPIADVIDNPFDSCPIKDPKLVTELAESMAAQGQRQPVLVCHGDDVARRFAGKVIMIEGHHRRDGGVRLKWPTIKALFVEVHGERELFEISQAVNEKRRRSLAAINQALSWRGALEAKLYASERELAQQNGLNHTIVNRTLKLLELPESVRERMKSFPERVGMKLGYAMFQYQTAFGVPELLKLADQVFTDRSDVTADQVDKYVALNRSAGTRQKKHVSRQFQIRLGSTEPESKPVGVLKDWDSGRIVVDIKIVDGDRRRELMAQLKKTLEIVD